MIVTGGDASAVLEPLEKALDPVAGNMKYTVDRVLSETHAPSNVVKVFWAPVVSGVATGRRADPIARPDSTGT